jgi:SAM-dependent methyltransferase
MDERGRIVAAGYDAVANEYAALEQPGNEWPRLRLLRKVLARIPPGVTVLDLGCGNGVPALVEIARSHEAVGVDLSGMQADFARANVPMAEVIQGDALELDFLGNVWGRRRLVPLRSSAPRPARRTAWTDSQLARSGRTTSLQPRT